MAVFRRRTRIVSFRLSDDEYEHLRQVSLAEGARSVSDYARAALCRWLANPGAANGDGLEAKVLQLDQQMRRLNDEIQRLNSLTGPGAEDGARAHVVR